VLPILTFCAHGLLAFSFALPGSDLDCAYFPIIYNVLACCASILGLIGALGALPSLVSAYTLLHTMTLSFVTMAVASLVLPLDFRTLNPVTPSYAVDESAICRDIDAGFGWDTEWLEQCSRSLRMIKLGGACFAMVLMLAQWWALLNVRRWGQELRIRQQTVRGDVEKAGLGLEEERTIYEKQTGF
jgi:hypothetical protein